MDWKDTVMGSGELNKAFDGDFGEAFFDHEPTAEDIFLIKLKLVAEAQAEITWDKAIREVVEFLNDTGMDAHTLIFQVSEKGWQAKLKSWSISA